MRDPPVEDRKAISNRGGHLRHALAREVNDERLAQAGLQLERVDAAIPELIRGDGTLRRRLEILTSIPGISTVTAAGLIVHMPELGMIASPSAASLAVSRP